jgi:hypothetical protein
VQALIFAKVGEGRFRPILHQVDLLPNGTIECEVLLARISHHQPLLTSHSSFCKLTQHVTEPSWRSATPRPKHPVFHGPSARTR